MKNFTVILSFLPFFIHSQIIVDQTNLPRIGDTIVIASDYSINNFATVGSSGPNQFWNFSNVMGSPEMILSFIDPTNTPYSTNFPSSNICAELSALSYYYMNRSNNGLSAVGVVDSGNSFSYSKMLLPTPLNYLDTIIFNSVLFQFDTVISPPIPSNALGIPGPNTIDSMKFISQNNEKYIVDAWGQVQIPFGTFDALRVFETNYITENISYKLTNTNTGLSQWVNDPNGGQTYWNESRYSWRTNDTTIKWSLAQIEVDSLGFPIAGASIEYFLANSLSNFTISPPLVTLDFLSEVKCYGFNDGFIVVDVDGTAYPFGFTWSGPNGFISNNKDIYNLLSGTYILTVTDANGNSSTDTFFVSEPPPISAQIVQSNNDLTVLVNGGTPPYNYFWNTGDVNQSITVQTNGSYSCNVSDQNGCNSNLSINITNVSTYVNEDKIEDVVTKSVDLLGRIIYTKQRGLIFNFFDDGSVKKTFTLD